MTSFVLTPKNPYLYIMTESDCAIATLNVYNWFLGVFEKGEPVKETAYPISGSGRPLVRWAIPTQEETLAIAYAKDRLLLVTGKDYTDTDPINYTRDPNVHVPVVLMHNSYVGKQVLVTFDIEALRPNKVQLYLNEQLVGNSALNINGRCRRGVLLDVTQQDQSFCVALRPASKELYVYSVQIDII